MDRTVRQGQGQRSIEAIVGRTSSPGIHGHHGQEQFVEMAGFVPAVVLELPGNLATPGRTLRSVVWEAAEPLQHHDAESPNVDSCGVRRSLIDLRCQVSTRTTQRLEVVALLREAKVGQLHVDAVLVSMFHEDVPRADVSMHDGRLACVKAAQR